ADPPATPHPFSHIGARGTVSPPVVHLVSTVCVLAQKFVTNVNVCTLRDVRGCLNVDRQTPSLSDSLKTSHPLARPLTSGYTSDTTPTRCYRGQERASGVLPAERRKLILELVDTHNSVSVTELCERLDVSEMT